MRILINVDLRPGGTAGGVEQFVMGLLYGLARLRDGPEEYVLIQRRRDTSWLDPYIGPNQRIVFKPQRKMSQKLAAWVRDPAGTAWSWTRKRVFGHDWVAQSDGFYESLGGDVIHFPFQRFIRSEVPAVFNPHDLQHLHLPEFYKRRQIARRESTYREACRLARAVVAPTQAVRDDLIRSFGLDPAKVWFVHHGAPTALYKSLSEEALQQVRQQYDLPAEFALYPAQTWKHKNHIRLLQAIQLLRDRDGHRLNLICTGHKNDFWPTVEAWIEKLTLTQQIRFVGFVPAAELRALYGLAQFAVFPSLFEGGGLPVLEAFHEGVPLACSDIPPLREYTEGAALQFDPQSVESIAGALLAMAKDADLRTTLRKHGQERSRIFTWERAARKYRALYRHVAGRVLSAEERCMLAEGPAAR
ncbi:MAG: glycosyltransferase family 1 protein [Terriglobales bacterium]